MERSALIYLLRASELSATVDCIMMGNLPPAAALNAMETPDEIAMAKQRLRSGGNSEFGGNAHLSGPQQRRPRV